MNTFSGYNVDKNRLCQVILFELPQYRKGHLSCHVWSSAHFAKRACERATTNPECMMSLDQEPAPDIVSLSLLLVSFLLSQTSCGGQGVITL